MSSLYANNVYASDINNSPLGAGRSEQNPTIERRQQQARESLGNTLLIGAGPAAIQMAVLLAGGWVKQLGIASRSSDHWSDFQAQYKAAGQVSVVPAKLTLTSLAGVACFECCYGQLDKIENQWDTMVLCVPADGYQKVLKQIPLQKLDRIQRVILLSSSFGAHLVVNHQFQCVGQHVEVVSLSTYFAATKGDRTENNEGKCSNSRVNVITKARKKRIYLASYPSPEPSTISNTQAALVHMWGSVGIDVVILSDCFSVEARSITAYVHPPLFVNEFSLNQLLDQSGPPKYMYKLFPEGPITPVVMKEMVQLWKDISSIVRRVHAEPINLLKFLNDDNYPVLEKSIRRFDIDNFDKYTADKQEYLLYVRYASILVDPFSEPNKEGRYFDFSAVPFPKAVDENNVLIVPRVPLEDMKAMYVFYDLAKAFQLPVVAVSRFVERFEQWFETHLQHESITQNHQLIEQLKQSSQQVAEIILHSLDLDSDSEKSKEA
ncbi:opine metallophore biosynthesis dehydrogenase [Vibrio sp. Of7-15]|uniref:opine metallophore biosynthesis dehydrogenase n=1 Tax=Vibrio sp. Of7-15 TaxID=2724879 RepID=UPI001EF1A62F|nr:opine metallophore biosynthesis dehydrogenase [Vibrio sp. Of7-15]MCG7497840.1 opine metallophore biosynthesis dehydrogenase [Vibrio sp. Of7-15]